jgi:uncharacterized protein (TIGR02996 family)
MKTLLKEFHINRDCETLLEVDDWNLEYYVSVNINKVIKTKISSNLIVKTGKVTSELGSVLNAFNVISRFPGSRFQVKALKILMDIIFKEEIAFLRSIEEAPNDELPKKIYADWLDEHGRWTEARLWRHNQISESIKQSCRVLVELF